MNEISVQVPVKNGGDVFRRYLGSLARQDFLGRWELVVVDDESEVPVETQFQTELQSMPDKCSVKVIRLVNGGNRPVARNAALEASTSQVGLLMDADLEFPPELLRRHLEVRKETGAHVIMGKRINAWSSEATPWQRWMDSRAMGDSPAGPFPWNYFITGNLSVRTKLLIDAGGFDPAINLYGGEDTEMGYRLGKMGTRFHWEPSLHVNHLDDVTVRKHSMKMIEYGSSGLKYTLSKHSGTRGLLGSRWVEPLFTPPLYLIPMRIAVSVALLAPCYRVLLRAAETLGGPSIVFTWLSVGACLAGLKGKELKL